MKVGCQQCGASYSVADEKVAGRKLKLRCKKCGEPMVIDGSAQDSVPFPQFQVVTAGPSDAPATTSESEWFVAIDDQPQGPYTQQEVQAHYAAGLISPDTLVFREGLTGWTRARDVAELEAPGRRASALPPPPPPQARSPHASTAALAREVPMGRDPFADSVPPFSQPYSPHVSAEEMLAAAPREGTVQFSLDDIRALSAVSAPSVAPAAPLRPGYASGSGSGLIDVRSLSESAQGSDAYRPIGGGLQASPLDTMAPFAIQASAPRGGVDFRTKVLAGVASFGFLLLGAVGVLAITRTPPQAAVVPLASEALPRASAAAVTGAPAQTAAAAMQGAERAPAVAAAAEPTPPTQAEREPAGGSEPTAVEREGRALKTRRRGARTVASKSDAPVAERTAAKTEHGSDSGGSDIDDILVAKSPTKETKSEPASAKPDKPAASKGSDDLDALLLGAIDGKKAAAPKPAAEPEESALPKTPSREQILATAGKAKAKIAKCKGTGVATAAITIANSGRVTSVSVSGVDGSAKSCVESAVRSTPFPKFQQPTFAVKFPFKLGG